MRGTVNHIDLTVTDPDRSLAFYEAVLGYMGYFQASSHARGYDFDLLGPDGERSSVAILRSQGTGRDRRHDRYSPGLHHLAWTARDRADVDGLHSLLIKIGATVLDPPAEYSEYGAGYYAVFFSDPDGIKLEFVHWPRSTS
jgi:catechol 2,3-dioxygenase-like lactoylglutathione lyase family enzyme